MITETNDIILSIHLEHQQSRIDTILKLWDELQTSSADVAQAPRPDMFSFADTALYFAVILKKPQPEPDKSKKSSKSIISGDESDAWSDDLFDLFPETGRSAIDTMCPVGTPIGIVFLTTSAQIDVPSGEISIGIVLDQCHRGQGFGRQAVKLLMKWVFDDMKFHRMQAVILDGPSKVNAMTLFTRLGFGHEGVRRRAVYCRIADQWKDTTYLAMLDTDWFVRSYFKPAPKTLWDEMFSRHQKEREDLLRWEHDSGKLKRQASAETVRLESAPSIASGSCRGSDLGLDSDDEIDAWDDHECEDSDPIYRAASDSPPPTSESEMSIAVSEESDFRDRDAPLNVNAAVFSPRRSFMNRNISPEGSVGSQWDLLETSSSRSSSSYDCLSDEALV